ncbi:rCG24058 [Rattus norvegicus]|uniref:RCG24058 n=1 Tax=Rattus norvegicus TaxID=10116 RepID=A6JST2_RAT|nr:rCG24058 [Rattus norvegicus]
MAMDAETKEDVLRSFPITDPVCCQPLLTGLVNTLHGERPSSLMQKP